jgi:hypothetical protein
MHYKNENPFNQVHINNILRLKKHVEMQIVGDGTNIWWK